MSSEWKKVRISDIGKVITGRTPASSNPEDFGLDIPFVTPTDMTGSRFAYPTQRYLSKDGAMRLSKIIIPSGVAVSCIGWQMGKAVIINRPSVTNQQINTIIPNEKYVSTKFLYYLLSTKRQIVFNLGAGGSRTPILNKSDFEKIYIDIPNLDIQEKITWILDTLDSKIEINAQMNHTLEAMARALFKSWFVDFDPVKANAEGRRMEGIRPEVQALFPSEFEDSPLGPVPLGWEQSELGAVMLNPRKTIDPSDVPSDTFYIGLEHIPRKSIALSDWGQAHEIESQKLVFHKHDILFGKLRPYFHKVSIAPFNGICSSDILVIRPKPDWYGFVMQYVSSTEMIEHTTNLSNGTRMPRASWSDLAGYPVVLPPVDIARHYTNLIQPLIDQINLNIFENVSLQQTRDTLLPKLLSGELDVSQLSTAVTAD